jgi:hypothetical protein
MRYGANMKQDGSAKFVFIQLCPARMINYNNKGREYIPPKQLLLPLLPYARGAIIADFS